MTLYHATSAAAAGSIDAGGFIDGRGSYLCEGLILEGVFVSDWPLDEGAGRDAVLYVFDVPDPDAIAEYELVEDGKPYREWCVPAAIVNGWRRRRGAKLEELAWLEEAAR